MIEELRTRLGPLGLDWIDGLFWLAAALVVWKVWSDLDPTDRLPLELYAMLVSLTLIIVIGVALALA